MRKAKDTRPLRVLTNMRLYRLAGIAQYVTGLISHNETNGDFKLFGVDVLRPDEPTLAFPTRKRLKLFRLLRAVVDYPDLGSVNQLSQGDIAILRDSFKGIIAAYARAIRRVKPDVIVLNGSYFLPWCLLQAAQDYGKAAICMHYHGILTKEVAHWPNAVDRALMLAMERGFDRKDILYIFPSQLARRTVEREVFGHRIANAVVLPNPVAPEFFTHAPRRAGRGIGVVSRWTKIKNMDFVISMAKRDAKARERVGIDIISDLKSPKDTRAFGGLMRFRKPMANEKLARFYGSRGVVISPSHFETYGNVAQEALASGTPALVSTTMGVAETFRKIGLSDWVVDFTSPVEILKKARSVASARVPEKAISALFNECSSGRIFSRYAEILRSA
jgi:glycosyltransferase involved in cell wall biosynthesis